MQIRIKFLGAAQNVTGSCYYVEANGARFIIDCGIYQERDLKYRNWEPFPIPPKTLDAVLLTHAHLDHCGLLPKLVREGFWGKIYCTEPTTDIARIILIDSAKIQEEDALFKRHRHEKEGRRGVHPEVPLYTLEDVEETLPFFYSVKYGKEIEVNDGVTAAFYDAGHILGSSMIMIRIRADGEERALIFSGDVGRWNTPILRDPTVFETADYIFVESTYGDRLHGSSEDVPKDLARIITDTVSRGGNIVIPSFAVERTQELLYWLSKLLSDDIIPHLPVFLDSPMAISITEIFKRYPELFDKETQGLLQEGKHPCDFPGLILSRTVEKSKSINYISGTAIIIAGSGMCTGGRIKYHLERNISRMESTILFVGYQALGTLGRKILDGDTSVRILGQEYSVNASIEKITGFSAHADRDELYRWLSGFKGAPKQLFVIHGESNSALSFSEWLRDRTGWSIRVAAYKEEAILR